MKPTPSFILRGALWALAAATPVWALDPSLPPSGNFDLTHWNLTLPVDSSGGITGSPVTISTADLQGFTDSYFYTGADGAMVFYCPAVGAHTSGSTHPRTELRELLDPNANIVDWTADGSHSITGSVKVNALAAYPNGGVSLAQVHGYSSSSGYGVDTPFLILKYDTTKSPTEVWASVQYLVSGAGDPNHGNSTHAHLGFGTAALGATIGYTIEVRNGVAYVTVSGTSSPGTKSVDFYGSDTGWKGIPFYFKAGDYYVNNDGSTASQVSYYALDKSHVVQIADDFSSSNAAVDRAPWFAHSTSTLNVTNHTLVLSPLCTALTYFTSGNALSLAAGDTLQATFQLTLQGTSFPNTNDFFRVALLNSCSTESSSGGDPNHSSSPQRVSADGYAVSSSTFNDYSGYMVGVNLAPSSASAMKIYSRTPATKSNSGVVSTGSYTQIGSTGGEGGNYGFTANTVYTGTLTIHRDISTGAVTATLTFIGTGGAYWRYSLTDNLAGTPTYTFDTLAFYLSSGGSLTSATLDNLAVTYSLHP